jgi:hypothetical protein
LKDDIDENFDKLIADLLDEDELKFLMMIVKNKGELEKEGNDV